MAHRPEALLDKIVSYLTECGLPFRTMTHEPTLTSEDSARARGESLSCGGKALLLKADGQLVLVVLSAARKANFKKLRRALGAKELRFANESELKEHQLTKGAVPPFGFPILPCPLYIDQSVLDNEKIAFNAGSLTDSIIMATQDYLRAAGGTLGEFSE